VARGSTRIGFTRVLGAAFGTPELRRLQLAWAACSIGGWAFMVALAIYAYGVGGAVAVGLAALARMLPAGLAAPFTGLLGDRHSRRDVLVGITVLRALVLAGVAAAVATGAGLGVVLALAALFTIATTAHRPAQAGLLPVLARTPAQLAAANAVWSGVDNAGFLVGALVGGVAVAATSVEAVFGATAALFGLAAALTLAIPHDPVPPHRERALGATAAREALLGLETIGRDRRLRLLVGVLSVSTLVEGAIDVLVVITALELLDIGAAGVGWLNAGWGLGGLIGGAAALALLGRGRLAAGLGGGGLLAGLPLLFIGAVPAVSVALAMLVVVGLGYALVEVAGLTLMQRLTSDEALARAFGVVESSYQLTIGIGSMLAPVAIALLGVRGALVALGLCLPLTVVLRWAALARFEADAVVPRREFAALRAVPLFAALPLATVENLSRRITSVPVSAGQAVIREGDRGDRFYVVETGRMEVRCDGRLRSTAAPGDFFGEIALVRDVPRTATVTAVGEALLFALERDDFVAAVTGHRRCVDAADAVIEARLANARTG
jgi:hypothetical protein